MWRQDQRRAVVAVCRGGLSAADCLRESRQPATGAGGECGTGNRGARGIGREQNATGWSRLTESLLLASIGGAAGAGLAFAGVRLFLSLAPPGVPRLDEVRVNTPVLLFAAAISIVSAIGFGILPALRSLRVHPQAALQGNSARMANTQGSNRTRSVMLAVQVACTVVLLIVTSLPFAASRT